MFNGLPAILVEEQRPIAKLASRYTIHCEVNEQGCISALHAVVAPSKLSALR
jgi:hypothetical protein